MRMIHLESLYALIEGNFDFLLVVDATEMIIYVSPLLKRACSTDDCDVTGTHLDEILDQDSLESFRKAFRNIFKL